MLEPNSEYWICFSLLRLQILNEAHSFDDQLFTIYQIEIYYNEKFISSSKAFGSLINEHLHIPLLGNNLRFKFSAHSKKQNCQIHFVSIDQDGERNIRGSYQFSLSNYIKAHRELRRNCMDMSVEISPNLMLVYQVFIEKTEEAINLIIQQHSQAKKFNFREDNGSQADSFFALDINQEGKLLSISPKNSFMEMDRPISPINSTKPVRKNKMHSRQLSSGEKNTDFCKQKLGSTLVTEPSRKSFLKLSKTQSFFSEDIPSNNFNNCPNMSNQIQELEIQSRNDSQDQQDHDQKLYQVLKKDSRIYIHKPNDQQEQTQKQHIQKQQEGRMLSSDKKKNRLIKRYDSLLKHSFLAIMIIVVIGFFIFFFFDQPTNTVHKKIKKMKKPKTN